MPFFKISDAQELAGETITDVTVVTEDYPTISELRY